jgi:hypothetical protein
MLFRQRGLWEKREIGGWGVATPGPRALAAIANVPSTPDSPDRTARAGRIDWTSFS